MKKKETVKRKLIRYEGSNDDIWALWEGEDGHRWYEHIVIDGVVQW